MSKTRMAITIDEDLHKWAKEYTKKNRTTISHILNQYLLNLKINKQK